jgi:hypothetical protein
VPRRTVEARQQQQQKNRSPRRETRERCRRNCCAPRQIPGLRLGVRGSAALRRPLGTTGMGNRARLTREEATGYIMLATWGLQKGNPCAALNARQFGKAHGRQAKVSSRTREIRLSGILGGLGKRDHGGIVNPPRNRKGETGNPSPESRRPRARSQLSVGWVLSSENLQS